MKMNLGDGDAEIDADSKSGGASEQADQDKDAAEELGEGGEISRPAGKAEAFDELNVMVKAAENFVISVADHDGADGETHDEKCQRLQTIEVAHGSASEG